MPTGQGVQGFVFGGDNYCYSVNMYFLGHSPLLIPPYLEPLLFFMN